MAEYLHPEQRNLAADLDDDELAKIAVRCFDELKSDEESRQEWLDRHAEWVRLYFQKDHPKNPPWEGSSTEGIPMLAESCNQFHARAYPAMFPNRNIIQAIPVGAPDEGSRERATRIQRHMSWQLLAKDRSYKKNKDRMLLSLPLHGSFFTKTYYCPVRKRNVIDNVRAIDLVVPYGTGPRELEDIPRKSQIIPMPVNRTRQLAQNGFFIAPAEPWQYEVENEVDQAQDDVEGWQQPAYESKDYARLIEQHRLLDLDGDGIEEPYIVTLDAQSRKVLRVSIRYDTDEAGNPTADKEPVEYFTHYCYLENPDGFYGLGQGHMIAPLNTAVNKLLRQSIDAGTLANVLSLSGIVSKQISLKKGEINLQLGKFITSESTAEDLSKGIWQPRAMGPNAALLQILQLIMSRSDRLATVTEALVGQMDKVIQPTALLALIEQGLQVFSTVYERVLTSWEDELMKIYRLNYKHMDPQEYFAVQDTTGEMSRLMTAREDYRPDFHVKPIVDPKMSTKQQTLAKAEAEYQAVMTNPLSAQSPQHIYNATRRYLEAIGSENIEELLPNPAEGQLPRQDNPYAENMGALMAMPMMTPVFPEQNHLAHLQAHMELLTDPDWSTQLSPAGRAALEDHIQSHKALLYRGVEGAAEQAGPPSMGAVAGGGMVLSQAGGAVQPEPGMGLGSLMGAGPEIAGPAGGLGGDGGPF